MDYDWHIWSYIRRDGAQFAGMEFGSPDQQERPTGILIHPGNSELLARNDRALECSTTTASISTGTWYFGHTHIQPSTDTIYAELFDIDGNQLGETTLNTSENLSARPDQALHLSSWTWQGYEQHSYFDDIEYKWG